MINLIRFILHISRSLSIVYLEGEFLESITEYWIVELMARLCSAYVNSIEISL
jgi:hypothetical protein